MSDDKLIKWGVWIAVLMTPVCFIGCYAGSSFEQAKGYKDGTIQKLSETGVVYKTTEGEMVLGGMSIGESGEGQATFNRQMFEFSVNDASVRAKIEALKPGQKVRLHYRMMLSTWCPKGNTSYFVTDVETIK